MPKGGWGNTWGGGAGGGGGSWGGGAGKSGSYGTSYSSRPTTPATGVGGAAGAGRPTAPTLRTAIAPTATRTATPAQPQAGVKRPAGPTPAGPAVKKPNVASGPAGAAGAQPSFTVTTQSKRDEIGIQTLVGDYVERGTNHGRKYYQKVQEIPGHKDVKVFLYYWDTRDGQDFTGWWFGDELGGSQVWARCNAHGMMPPRIGWKIPWDSPKSEPGLLFCDPYKPGAAGPAAALKPGLAAAKPGLPAAKPGLPAAKPGLTGAKPGLVGAKPAGSVPSIKPTAGAGGTAAQTAWGGTAVKKEGAATPGPQSNDPRVKKASANVTSAETTAKQAVNKAKLMNDKTPEALLKQSEEALVKEETKLREAQKSLSQEIAEARKGGNQVVVNAVITDMSKLSTKIREAQSAVTNELKRIRGMMPAAKARAAEQEKKNAANQESQRKLEAQHLKEYNAAIPKLRELVSTAEDGVEACNIMASPLVSDPPEDQGEALKRAMDEIQAAATEAQNAINDARKELTARNTAAKNYAGETKKTATAELNSLQGKLNEAQKRVNPYKKFKDEFQLRVKAKRDLAGIADRISSAELEVEKAKMMSEAADRGQMAEDEVTSAAELVTPAKTELDAVTKLVDGKLKSSQGPMAEELQLMKKRLQDLSKQLGAVSAVLQRQREGLVMQQMVAQASEIVEKAEEMLVKCQDSELPFLKGIEVLPPDESAKASKACDEAGREATTALTKAKSYVTGKTFEVKKKPDHKATLEELQLLADRVQAVEKKLNTFKADTLERKLNAKMSEVLEAVGDAEKKVQEITEAAAVFSGNVESTSIETLKEASEKCKSLEKEFQEAMMQARKVLQAKMKESKEPEIKAALNKSQSKLSSLPTELTKIKKSMEQGEKLLKGKRLLADETEKMQEVEANVKKAEDLSKPKGDEKLSDEDVRTMDALVLDSLKAAKNVANIINSALPNSVASLKSGLQKLVDRSKAAVTKLDAVKASTKEQRERVMSASYVEEGTKITEEVETAMEKVNQAEMPFLKGIEVLPLKEAQETIKASEEAATVVSNTINKARTLIASKNLEIKQFDAAYGKPAEKELSALTERVNNINSKLSQFRKDNEGRKKSALMQEAGERITALEEEVKTVATAVEPIVTQDPEETSPEEAAEMCKKFATLEQATKAKAEEARKMLADRQKDTKGDKDKTEAVQALQARLTAINQELQKARKAAAGNEEKFTAKRILGEASALVKTVDEEFKKAEDFCAPLIKEEGEPFLVLASISIMGDAMKDHMKEKELDVDGLFKEVAGGKKVVSEEKFVAYLTSMPEALSRPECDFTEARRAAIFKKIDANGDGKISLDEFKAALTRRYNCVHAVSVTDAFDIGKSKTIAKLEPGEGLESMGASQVQKAEDGTGLPRMPCKLLAVEKEGKQRAEMDGWVTVQGNNGTKYLEVITEFKEFGVKVEQTISAAEKASRKSAQELSMKVGKAGHPSEGSALKEALKEVGKLRTQLNKTMGDFGALKSRVSKAKADCLKKEKEEANAHIIAAQKKEADTYLEAVKDKLSAMEAATSKLDEAAAPLVSLKGAELGEFATPLEVLTSSEACNEASAKSIEELRTAVQEQQAKTPVQKAASGPMLDAKREFSRLMTLAQSKSTGCSKTMQALRKACKDIAEAKVGPVSDAMRQQVQEKGLTPDGFFSKLAGKSSRIPEEAFCKHLQKLPGLSLTADQAKLVARHIEAGGVGPRSFAKLVQSYYAVQMEVAITDHKDISKCSTKPLKKAVKDELIEALEGPVQDEEIKLPRIRGRSMVDGVVGWITVKGNQQGKVFLRPVEKPFFTTVKDTPLEKEFGSGSELVRSLKADEVLELLEGPRKETFESTLQARGKAVSDGKVGWFTVKDKSGKEMARKDGSNWKIVQTIALTDDRDMEGCKIIRTLANDEVFIVSEGPIEDPEKKVSRVKGKAVKDDAEGWITVKGNAGSTYAKINEKLYSVVETAPMRKMLASDSEEIRTLQEGEAVEIMEGPKEERQQPAMRVRCRTVSDGVEGWVTLRPATVRPHSYTYKCTRGIDMHAELEVADATKVRHIGPGESLDCLEGPTESGGLLRMRARAVKDGASGWVTIKEADGKKNFAP